MQPAIQSSVKKRSFCRCLSYFKFFRFRWIINSYSCVFFKFYFFKYFSIFFAIIFTYFCFAQNEF